MDFNELQKNQWHCEKCKTNWLTYTSYYDTCPLCGAKDPVLVRVGSIAQKEGLKEWWNEP
jgi:hypothetical protein